MGASSPHTPESVGIVQSSLDLSHCSHGTHPTVTHSNCFLKIPLFTKTQLGFVLRHRIAFSLFEITLLPSRRVRIIGCLIVRRLSPVRPRGIANYSF
jgi:hypothetical protein